MGMFRFEEDWVEATRYSRRFRKMGYEVLKVMGKYLIYKVKEQTGDEVPRSEILRECDTQEELESFCKLILSDKPSGKETE
jgi:hypothetical protein